MKKNNFYTIFLIGFWVLLLGIALPVKGQTLTTVFSDDFEARTVGTAATANGYLNTNSTTGSSQVIANGTGNSGTKYVNMTGTATSPNNCYLTKQVSVTSGQTYIFSIYTLGVSNKASSIIISGTSLGTQNKGNLVGNGTWQNRSYTFTATATETVNLTVYMWSTGNVYVDDILFQRKQWNITASSNDNAMGSVSGGGLKDPGTNNVTLTATPNSGYYFVNWTENGTEVSVSSTYIFSATADRTLVANFAPVSASMTVTGTLTPFSSTYGTASAEQSFTVEGSSLTSDIVVTPPTGFEVSTTSDSGFQSSVTLTQSSGTVASTTIYVRLKALAAAGTYNAANITVNTTGSSQNVSCSGYQEKKPLTVTGYSIAPKTYNGNTTSGTITVGTLSGFVGSETVTATAACTLSSPNVYGETGTIVYTLVNGTNGGLASNYSLANTTYWAQINQRQLNITAGNQTVTYGTPVSNVTAAGTYSPTGFAGSDNASIMGGTATYTTTYTNTTAVGATGITITYDAGLTTTYGNYWFNKIAGTITVIPATPTVTPTIGTYIYDGNPQGPTAATNSGTGTSYTFSYVGTGNTSYGPSENRPTVAGTYTVTVTVAADGNYAQASSTATAFSILSPSTVSSDTNVSDLVLSSGTNLTVSNGVTLTIDATTEVASITVAPSGKLTVNAQLTGALTLESDENGTATLLDTYSEPTVNATVKQWVTAGRNWYVSPSISAGTASMLSRGDSVVQYNEVLKKWEKVTGNLTPGRGYIQVATSNPLVTGTTGTVDFSGLTNSGTIPVTVTRTESGANRGFNLVGNPYPSFLNSATFLSANNTKIEGNIWYRTHTGTAYEFNTYNSVSDQSVPKASNGSYIPPMQGFWVRALSTLNTLHEADRKIEFTNAMRKHNDSTVVIKLRTPKAPVERQFIRLQVSNDNLYDELLIYSDANASNNYDAYDAPKMMNTSSSSAVINLYTKVGAENLVIDGRNTLPLDVVMPVTFAVNALASGSYSISANELTNLPSGVTVKIIDNGIENSLNDGGTYTFTADAGTTKTFGLILRSPGTITGVENDKADNFRVYANSNRQIVIIAPVKSNYAIFNTLGQLIQIGTLNSEHETLNTKLSSGIYVVKTENQSTRVFVK